MFIAWLNRKKNSCHIKFPPFYFPGLEWPNTHRRTSHKYLFRVQGGRTFLLGKLKNSSKKMDKTYLSNWKPLPLKRYIIWICNPKLKPYHKINQELFFKVCFIGPFKCFGYTCGPPKIFFLSVYVLLIHLIGYKYLMLCKDVFCFRIVIICIFLKREYCRTPAHQGCSLLD
jgi:hypothetical protein